MARLGILRLMARAALVAACAAAFVSVVSAGERRAVRSLLELRHDRVVVQAWDLSCGAAALTTLLNHQHGDPVTEREVALGLIDQPRYLANPHLVRLRHGFSLLDLKRYVDARGYRGIGFGGLDVEDLVARAPIMVPIRSRGYNHFVIFRGRLGNRVLLADPAFGNRTMTVGRFEEAWIDHGEVGHVGFVVTRGEALAPPGALQARPGDFVTLR